MGGDRKIATQDASKTTSVNTTEAIENEELKKKFDENSMVMQAVMEMADS